MGLVSQEPILFQGTIAENIAWGAGGMDKVTMDDIIEVCEWVWVGRLVSVVFPHYPEIIEAFGSVVLVSIEYCAL